MKNKYTEFYSVWRHSADPTFVCYRNKRVRLYRTPVPELTLTTMLEI